jgi:hypothetical protein
MLAGVLISGRRIQRPARWDLFIRTHTYAADLTYCGWPDRTRGHSGGVWGRSWRSSCHPAVVPRTATPTKGNAALCCVPQQSSAPIIVEGPLAQKMLSIFIRSPEDRAWWDVMKNTFGENTVSAEPYTADSDYPPPNIKTCGSCVFLRWRPDVDAAIGPAPVLHPACWAHVKYGPPAKIWAGRRLCADRVEGRPR